MQKLLIIISLSASVLLSGCSSTIDKGLETLSGVTDIFPDDLDLVPTLYKPTILQGNKIEQAQINKLQPGMAKRQVQFLMGTPMLTDVFHRDRWDYVFTSGEGSEVQEISKLAIFFENEKLVSVSGDYFPQPHLVETEPKKEISVPIPDWEAPEPSMWDDFLIYVGLIEE